MAIVSLRVWLFVLVYCMDILTFMFAWAALTYLLSCSLYPENTTPYKTAGVNPTSLFCPSTMYTSCLSKHCTKQKARFWLLSELLVFPSDSPEISSISAVLASQIVTPQIVFVFCEGFCWLLQFSHLQRDCIWWVQTFTVLQIGAWNDGSKGRERSNVFCLAQYKTGV